MEILYFGKLSEGSTAVHRADALRRLGFSVMALDPYLLHGIGHNGRWATHINYRTGFRFIQRDMRAWTKTVLEATGYVDVIWVDNGELFGAECVKTLRAFARKVVLYNHDDPTGARDGARFESLKGALPYYDICVVPREVNVGEYYAYGAREVLRVLMSHDELVHRPVVPRSSIPDRFRSDVAFIGTWMRDEGRDEFLMKLVDRGVPVSIWGARWEKSRYWRGLRRFWRGGPLTGRDYASAIGGAKICLGLLSRGNRDRHTTRSFEIPFAGGLLCAEGTDEHRRLYKEGIEAVFWSDADECAAVCHELLLDEQKRERIRAAGYERVRVLGNGHEDVGRRVMDRLREPGVFAFEGTAAPSENRETPAAREEEFNEMRQQL